MDPTDTDCVLCWLPADTTTTAPSVVDVSRVTRATLDADDVHDVKPEDVRYACGRADRRVIRAGAPLCCVCALATWPVEEPEDDEEDEEDHAQAGRDVLRDDWADLCRREAFESRERDR